MYDESIDVVDAEEVESASPTSRGSFQDSMADEVQDVMQRPRSARRMHGPRRTPDPDMHFKSVGDIESENSIDDDDDDEDDDDDIQAPIPEGAYDPKEYEHLPVNHETKELFHYITVYVPQNINLEYKLEPLVPEFIPAVGDIDGFLKIARPDGVDDKLGLVVLDEPCGNQSDPHVLNLQLRATSKQSSAKGTIVKRIENADKNPKAIEKWIKDINELHKSRPPPTIQYSRPMPDIDNLMQEWPPEFEQKLNELGLPLEGLEIDLPTYVDIICALFDIPRYESRIESLHVLFSLYSAIKNYKKNARPESEGMTPSTN